ncbi:MAG: pyridoxal phosphate-dependent aminotransferase [Prochlorothrix sp.]
MDLSASRFSALSSRMDRVQTPIIPVVADLIRQNPGTLSLGQGIVHYGPPPDIDRAIAEGMAHPQSHRYQAVTGIPPLVEAIRDKLAQDNGITVDDRSAIVVTAGSNMAFMNAILAITEPGDEVILQTPYYFNHEMAITMAGCQAVLVSTDDLYQLQLAAIEAAITPKTRAVVTISPNNPTGVVYPGADLRAVNQLCCDRGIYHISDEAYEYFTYDGQPHISPASFPGTAAHTISLFSLSKSYGFASWRIGYMVIPAHLLEPVRKIQDTILICPPVVSQYAALGALGVGSAYCRQFWPDLDRVRRQWLSALEPWADRCQIAPAQGAFYLFLQLDTDLSALAVTQRWIEDHRVAVIPGSAFGCQDSGSGCALRLAYGVLQGEAVDQAIDRVCSGLKALFDRP